MRNEETIKKVNCLIERYEEDIINWRRHLHQNPELSFEEFETSEFIAEKLNNMGYAVKTRIGGTGVVGLMDTGNPGPVIAFRADMDALPILEATELPYESRRPGVMHACGHDVHMAVLLGTAQILADMKDALTGCIKVVFQPGEESNGGARCMIDGGALADPAVESIFALHIVPFLPAGMIGVKDGYLSATDDQVVIRIRGISTHSSEPETGVNAITIAANVITMLQSIQAEKLNPFDVATFSICQIKGGETDNVLPDNVEMRGMIRCIEKKHKMIFRERVESICTHTAAAFGGSAEVDFIQGFPSVFNDSRLNEVVKAAAAEVLGSSELIYEIEKPHLGSEDFSYYQEEIPGVIFMLGAGMHGENRGSLHSASLNVHEDCIACGIKVFVSTALSLCGHK